MWKVSQSSPVMRVRCRAHAAIHRPATAKQLPSEVIVKTIPEIGQLVRARGFRFHCPGRVVRVLVLREQAEVDFDGNVRRCLFAGSRARPAKPAGFGGGRAMNAKIACPKCQAPAGMLCRAQDGRAVRYTHRARRTALQRAEAPHSAQSPARSGRGPWGAKG
jgi:hypothetical protein